MGENPFTLQSYKNNRSLNVKSLQMNDKNVQLDEFKLILDDFIIRLDICAMRN